MLMDQDITEPKVTYSRLFTQYLGLFRKTRNVEDERMGVENAC